jgi:hypothetical protein
VELAQFPGRLRNDDGFSSSANATFHLVPILPHNTEVPRLPHVAATRAAAQTVAVLSPVGRAVA